MGARKNEKRLYFLNSNVRLRLWEKAIFDQSGVDTSDKLIVQFYDDSLRRKLREVEQAKLDERGRQLAEISKTVFYVEQRSSEFEIKVRQFDFRAPKDNRDDL